MNHKSDRIEVALETQFESVDRAEEISLRAAQSCGFSEDDCQKICLAVREGVVNAIRYGNQQQPRKERFCSRLRFTRTNLSSASSTKAAASTSPTFPIRWLRRTC